MNTRSTIATILGGLLLAGPTHSRELVVPLTGAQLVTGRDGKVSVLLPISAPVFPGPVALGSAHLRLPGLPVSMTRDLRIHVRVLRAPWVSGSDAQVHDDLVARLEVHAGSPARGIDVTNIVRGIASGEEAFGLLITAPEGSGSGFDATDAPLLLAAFDQAVLVISYRGTPPPPVRAR